MNCSELEAVFADYLGGELDQGATQTVESHLRACPACAAEAAALRGVVRTLDATRLKSTVVADFFW